MSSREPGLKERSCGREDKIGRTNADGQKGYDGPNGIIAAMRFPTGIGHDGRMPGTPEDNLNKQREHEDDGMHRNLRPRGVGPSGERVSIHIAGEQQSLKKQHARGPHRGGAAKPRQEIFA
jgi:hypothetical protein